MKTVNTTNQNSTNQDLSSSEGNSLQFSDVIVYNEMADHTAVRLNLLEQIKKQMNQLEEMSARREFLTKEILTYFAK